MTVKIARNTLFLFGSLLLIQYLVTTGCNPEKALADSNRASGLIVNSVTPLYMPVFINRQENSYFTVSVDYADNGQNRKIRKIILNVSANSDIGAIGEVYITCLAPGQNESVLFGKSAPGRKVTFSGDYHFRDGNNLITVGVTPSAAAGLTGKFRIESIRIILDDDSVLPAPAFSLPWLRFGTVIRAAGQDGCDTYRIPGLVTTNAGTLIAVYDNRYNNSKDLQEDIDIGMSRSTDGGHTWEPMKVVIDMGEFGGLPQNLNGTGDPSILYDHVTNTIWIAALWMSGSAPDKMLWWASRPGMTPEETGQFLLVKSKDDGITWSEPVNITGQIKDPAWQLLLQGPGRGITLKDGTLVFPAQFKADIGATAIDGGQYTCHSTIVWSKDGGDTWQISSGAKSNTTEAQVVQLSDGSLMLNMRDDRNRTDKGATNGRAVAVTSDLGMTWTVHPSSNRALPEPNCMASLIAAEVTVKGVKRQVLFFSNPDDMTSRIMMTVKASTDEGLTWPDDQQIVLYGPAGYGYSCLTMADENHVGILYEGVKELYFQKIPVSEFFDRK